MMFAVNIRSFGVVSFAVVRLLIRNCCWTCAFAPHPVGFYKFIRDGSSKMTCVTSNMDEQSTTSRRDILQSIMISCSCFSSPSIAANLPSSTGADLSNTGSIDTLIPIVAIQHSLKDAKILLTKSKEESTSLVSPEMCSTLLHSFAKTIPRDETAFKRVFDAYSTPVSYKQKFLDQNAFLVYYTKGFDGPGRPNIEEEDTNSIQTIQYGLRNDAWASVDDLFVELEFGQESTADDSTLSSIGELTTFVENVLKAVDSYLDLAPAADVKEARHQLGI